MAKKSRSKSIKSRKQKVGKLVFNTPGTIVFTGDDREEVVTNRLMTYNEESYETSLDINPETLCDIIKPEKVTWLDVDGVSDEKYIESVGRQLAIHPLVLEDIANVDHLPKYDNYEHFLFFTLKMISLQADTREIVVEHISFVLTHDCLLSFQERPGDVFDSIRERIHQSGGRVRKKKADYLFYLLIDTIVDHYYLVLEDLRERAYDLEEQLIDHPEKDRIGEVFELKREVASIRKLIFPLREAVNRLHRDESEIIENSTFRYFSDVNDHIQYVSEIFEELRETLTTLAELNLANVSNNMNKVMKTLTIIATIFIPLTFIAGVYGMNFKIMPELELTWGYPAALGAMGVVAIGLAWFIRRKGWF